MKINYKNFWDTFDDELYDEFVRQKQLYKFKKMILKMAYN